MYIQVRKVIPLILVACVGWWSVACDKSDVPVDPQDSDFWDFEDPAALGFDPDSIDLAIDRATSSANFYALLVVRSGKIAVERYFHGRDARSKFHLRSITKNFTSAITGIALEQGMLKDIDDPVGDYLEAFNVGEKSKITLRHLLNMTSGLAWNEDAEVVPLIQYEYPDPIKTISDRSVEHEPGITFNYNSVSPHIVSHILGLEAQQSFAGLAQEMLLDPLEITDSEWEKDPTGAAWGGFGLQLRARDLAKFGLLYLNGGIWEGRQLIPKDWVEQSRHAQVNFGSGSRGYSLQWWTSSNIGGLFYGQGYGGQALMVIPEKDLIIVACQDHLVAADENRAQWRHFADDVFLPLYRGAN